jgi:hypothetical protein
MFWREELAEFGYKSERNEEKLKNPAMFWWPAGTHCLNMLISERKIPRNLMTLALFHKNPFYELHWIYFFGVVR